MHAPLPSQMGSYVHGASPQPLIGETIGRHFDRCAGRWAERDALIACQQGIRLTYRELRTQVDAIAAGLVALGFLPGDRIGIWSPNTAEWTLIQFATAKAGIILVNINPAYRVAELEYALNVAGCAGLVLAPLVQEQRLCRHAAGPCPGDRTGGLERRPTAPIARRRRDRQRGGARYAALRRYRGANNPRTPQRV